MRRVAVPLGPAQVHAQQHLGEVGGVDATGAGADGHDGLALVVLPRQQRADLELAQVLAGSSSRSASASARVSSSFSSAAISTSVSRSSIRPSSLLIRSSSACVADSALVTFCAASGSSHRSGADACSDSSRDLGLERGRVAHRLDGAQGGAQITDRGGEVGGGHNRPGYRVRAPVPRRRSRHDPRATDSASSAIPSDHGASTQLTSTGRTTAPRRTCADRPSGVDASRAPRTRPSRSAASGLSRR